ncbi:MAG: hypothetical protein WBE20_10075 [Candidatus Acidiferrales bacterium]
MHCPRCKIALPDHAFSCPKCGREFASSRGADSRSLRAVLIIILILALVVWGFRSGSFRNLLKFAPMKSDYAESIASSSFNIKANEYASYKFVVPSGASGVWIDGHFTTASGSQSTFAVFVLRDDAFAAWQKGLPARTLYDSRRSPPNRIFAFLPAAAATYDLVFNNQYSLDAPASVDAAATLHYKK